MEMQYNGYTQEMLEKATGINLPHMKKQHHTINQWLAWLDNQNNQTRSLADVIRWCIRTGRMDYQPSTDWSRLFITSSGRVMTNKEVVTMFVAGLNKDRHGIQIQYNAMQEVRKQLS